MSDPPPLKTTNPVADYAKFAAWTFPSFIAWVFGMLVIMPKAEEVMPVTSPIFKIQQVNNFVFFNFWFLVVFLIALIITLEMAWKAWDRGARAMTLAILAWIWHFYVLGFMFLVAASALVMVHMAT